MSVVSCHQIDNEHKLDWENVIILDSEQSLYKRRISEMILKAKNGLDKQSEKLSDIYLLDIYLFIE